MTLGTPDSRQIKEQRNKVNMDGPLVLKKTIQG